MDSADEAIISNVSLNRPLFRLLFLVAETIALATFVFSPWCVSNGLSPGIVVSCACAVAIVSLPILGVLLKRTDGGLKALALFTFAMVTFQTLMTVFDDAMERTVQQPSAAAGVSLER